MIRYIGDGGCKLEAELCALCVCLGQLIKIVEGRGQEVVDSILGNVVACQNNSCNCNGGDIVGRVVDILLDGVLAVVGAVGDELIDVLLVKADEVDLTADGKVGDSGGGSACNDEGCVDLAVLQALSGVAEVEVLGIDVVNAHVVCLENVHCVEVNARAGSADGDLLALKIGNGLDVGIHGDDLDLLHVESCNNGEILDCAGVGEEVGAAVSIAHNVGLAECQLSAAGCKVLDVGLGAVADDCSDAGIGLIGNLLCKDGAECIIGAGLAAGDEGEVVAAAAACAQSEDHHDCENYRCDLFHFNILLFLQ